MTAYYNEFDPYAGQWLRNLIKAGLIPHGEVDTRSIVDVRGDDLRGFTQCHFFAGLGGWAYAARLAGWADDRPLWTGSCPCQPFSVAGKGEGQADARHLWPEWFRLIRECRPQSIRGEQVASAEVVGSELESSFVDAVQAGDFRRANKLSKQLLKSRNFGFTPRWLDGVLSDLEGEGYACGPVVLPACAVDAPHRRDRLWFVADTQSGGQRADWRSQEARRLDSTGHADIGSEGPHGGTLAHTDEPFASEERKQRSGQLGGFGGDPQSGTLGHAIGEGLEGQPRHGDDGREPGRLDAQQAGSIAETGGRSDVADAIGSERHGRPIEPERGPQGGIALGWSGEGAWHDAGWIIGADGKARRIPQSGIRGVAHGLSPSLAGSSTGSDAEEIPLLATGIPARVGKLRALGNAIVPQVAAEVIRAVM